jgi:hypothetical protein
MLGGRTWLRKSAGVFKTEEDMAKTKSADEIPLIPFEIFRKRAKRVLSNTKRQSDGQLAEFQASNARKREAKKKR